MYEPGCAGCWGAVSLPIQWVTRGQVNTVEFRHPVQIRAQLMSEGRKKKSKNHSAANVNGNEKEESLLVYSLSTAGTWHTFRNPFIG